MRPGASAAVEAAREKLAKLLGLDPNVREFRIVYGAVPSDNKEIAILTRSMVEILQDLASGIAVPEAHVKQGRVGPRLQADLGPDGPIQPLIPIWSSAEQPTEAFVAVPYRGYWFWIDDRDIRGRASLQLSDVPLHLP